MTTPPTVLVAPYVTIRRQRRMPAPGRIIVKAGDSVVADQTVAIAKGRSRLAFIDVARELGISEKRAAKAIRLKPEQGFDRGEVLASQNSFLGKLEARAPFGGRVVLVLGSRILLAADARELDIKAGMPGTVTNAVPDEYVEIEAIGAVIQGLWGQGREVFGELRPLKYDQVTANFFTAELAGTIAAVGCPLDANLLQNAQKAKVAGLIVSSIPSAMLGKLRRSRLPVLAVQGFGHQPMLTNTWTLLSDNTGREASLNPQSPNPFRGLRPELLIPLGPSGTVPPVPSAGEPLAPGRRVRILTGDYAGHEAVVTALLSGSAHFESGVRAPAVMVRVLELENEVLVAEGNLEGLENGTTVASVAPPDDLM